MTDLDDRLRDRLARLEEAAPVPTGRTAFPRATGHAVRVPIAAAGAVVLIAASVAFAAGALLDSKAVRGHPGLENDGEPFAGTNLHCMAPADAHRLIVARGYTPSWQIEDRPGDGKSGGTTSFSGTAPDRGVVQGGFVEGTVAHVVVRVDPDAQPNPGC